MEVRTKKHLVIDGQVSLRLIHCLIAIKNIIKYIVIKYCKKKYVKNGINLFWSVINSFKSKGLLASVSTYEFYSLYDIAS